MFSVTSLLAQVAESPVGAAVAATRPVGRSESLVERLGLEKTWEQTLWWHWLVLLGAIFVGVLLGRLLSSLLRRVGERLESRSARAAGTAVRAAATPVSLLVLTLALSSGLTFIAMDGGARDIVRRVLTLLYVLSLGWFLFNLVDLVDLWFRSLSAKTRSSLDDQLAPLIRKTLRVFLVVLFGLYVAQNVFNQNITAWLAGLGIAGLAVSLAAQESIKNLFGSITIFLDKPFAVGDRIVFDGFDGAVEEIGFRSTRVRTLAGEVATIPNSRFIENSVLNIARRPNIRKIIDVGVEYGTPPELIRRAVERVREVLAEPGIREAYDWEKAPPKAFFDEMKADNLNLKIIYWFEPAADWWAFMEHNQRVHLRIMEELTKLGVSFAFPTQTMVLTNEGEKPLLFRNVGGS